MRTTFIESLLLTKTIIQLQVLYDVDDNDDVVCRFTTDDGRLIHSALLTDAGYTKCTGDNVVLISIHIGLFAILHRCLPHGRSVYG